MSERRTRWKRILALLFFGPIVLVVFLIVAVDARHAFHEYREQSQCEAGNQKSCGYVALRLLRDSPDYGDKVRGMEMMKETCRQGFPAGCRMAAVFQGRRDPMFQANTIQVLFDRRDDVALTKCLEGEAKACFVAAHAQLDQRYESEERENLRTTSKKLCEQQDDPHACRAASMFESRFRPSDPAVHLKACRHGFANSCGWFHSFSEGDELDPAALEQTREVCSNTMSPPLCGLFAENEPKLRKELCWDGAFDYCAGVELDPATEHREVRALFYEELARLSDGDFVGYSFLAEPPDGAKEACATGTAEACFVLGADLVNNYHESWDAERARTPALDATYGRACELGMNAACLAMGAELLNRPPAERDIETANRVLRRGCQRNNAASCWMTSYADDLRKGALDQVAQASLRACKHNTTSRSACDFYVAVLEHEIGATPWVMSDRRMAAIAEVSCWEHKRGKGCRDIGHAADFSDDVTGSEIPSGLFFARLADVTRGCEIGNPGACSLANDFLFRWPVHNEERIARYRQIICEKNPRCETP